MSQASDRTPVFPFQLPTVQPDAQRYWHAAAEGQLLVKACDECQEAHFYPRAICPFCGSENTTWIEPSGRGTIYAFTVIRRGLPQPQATAFVTLVEGPTILSAILTENFDSLAIGQQVTATFVDHPAGRPFLMFKPD